MGFDRFDKHQVREVGGFWLVQRIERCPYAQHKKAFPTAKVKSNPFGYGRMGDYELDYMGAAEFEFGTIPAANNRLAEAGDKVVAEINYTFPKKYGDLSKRPLDILYIETEGEPFDVMGEWFLGGMRGKERPHDFKKKLTEPDYEYGGDVWWALGANVMWAFSGTEDEPGHLVQMLASMKEEPVEFLR